MKKLAIIGASGHGKIAAEIAIKQGWDVIDFFDALWPNLHETGRWKVTGNDELLLDGQSNYDAIFVAIGNNLIRQRKLVELLSLGFKTTSLIAPSAVVSSDAIIGEGVLIGESACVNVGARLSDGVIVNTGAIVEHDCTIDSFVHICPGVNLAGSVTVGKLSWIGIGSSIIQNIKICDEVMVGAGTVIIHDIPEKVTVVGVPAKIIK